MEERLGFYLEPYGGVGLSAWLVSYLYHAEVQGVAHELAATDQLHVAPHALHNLLPLHLSGTFCHLGYGLFGESLFIYIINNVAHVCEVLYADDGVFGQEREQWNPVLRLLRQFRHDGR